MQAFCPQPHVRCSDGQMFEKENTKSILWWVRAIYISYFKCSSIIELFESWIKIMTGWFNTVPQIYTWWSQNQRRWGLSVRQCTSQCRFCGLIVDFFFFFFCILLQWVDDMADAGADQYTFHLEATSERKSISTHLAKVACFPLDCHGDLSWPMMYEKINVNFYFAAI